MEAMPLAFITVSKLLRSQLEKMYGEIKNINNAALKSCVFLSLSDLLNGLAKRMDIKMDISNITSFKEYILERKSHSSLTVDLALVENEIGGVILGSLKSAELCRPLKWEEYQDDPRSNVTNKKTVAPKIRDNQMMYRKIPLSKGLNKLVLSTNQNKSLGELLSVKLGLSQQPEKDQTFSIDRMAASFHK